MKLGDFLNTLAQKSKIELDFGTLSNKKLDELNAIELDDIIVGQLDSSLMSLEGAKNNPAVLNHFKPIILKAADDKFAILAEKYGFSDEVLLEKSTYKKFDLLEAKLEAKIKDLESKQGKSSNPEKEAETTKQLNELTSKLASLTTEKETAISQLQKQHQAELIDYIVKSELSSKQYANKDIPTDVNILTAKTLLQQNLQAKGAVLVNDNGTLKLKQIANPEMDFVDEGFKPVSFQDFANKTLADNKLLSVSTQGLPPTTPAPTIIPSNAGQQINSSKFEAAMAEAQK